MRFEDEIYILLLSSVMGKKKWSLPSDHLQIIIPWTYP